MNDVWPARYSPADRPSRLRAAPAKNRIWSIIGGSSSDAVSPIGLPVLRDSAAMNSSARASSASAIFRRASCRSPGVESRHTSKPACAAVQARSMSSALERGAVANTSPVQGSIRSVVAPSAASTSSPLMKLRITSVMEVEPCSDRCDLQWFLRIHYLEDAWNCEYRRSSLTFQRISSKPGASHDR